MQSLPALPQNTESFAPRKLLIVRLGSMGDIIHTLPAVTALRRVFPEAILGWVVEECWAELLCTLPEPRSGPLSLRRPLVDRVHTVNTKAWRASPLSTQTWEQIAAGFSEVRAQRYEVAVDFQGAVRSALIARWSGSPVVYGFAQPRENVASMFYTSQVSAHGSHIVEQNLSLAEGVADHPLDLPKIEFPRDQAVEDKCNQRFGSNSGDFAVLNPGAGWGAKRWPAERYGHVAKRLAETGVKSLINFGPGEEHLMREVESASGGAATGVACSLTELIALTRRARVFIGGDTGPMHLAAALGIPVVAIFGPTNPARNGPFATRSIILRSPISPTSHSRRAQADPGLLEIGADEVFTAARTLLRSARD
ncbi:MAG TPA: glycosyltransferase family 9 protein [Verrucomicrobiae bacterium]|jgi:heptosyltransferase-1|nr:glycosyltransferase family 9 protein [Verrucomicrobiae bacterium]